ncbi:AAA family ATPase [Actinokineospora iranica]|nr:AAA family ATPase [Actinokineospora iranica]
MRAVRWLWDGRVPAGALTLIPGREGIGKSQFACWLTAQVTRGMLPGVFNGQSRSVVYAASEDSWAHTVAPRLSASGADLDLVYRADVVTGGMVTGMSLPRDCEELGAEITRLGAGLVVLDPLLSVIASTIDTHRDRELRIALEPLVRMADDTGCAIVGLAHFNKSVSADPLTLITGSRAFSAVARAVLAVARDEDDPDRACVISQAKNNLGSLDVPSLRYRIDAASVSTEDGPAEVGRLVMLGETTRSVADILAETDTDPDARFERDDAATWLRDYLIEHHGTAQAGDVIKAARADGIAEATLKRARKRVGVTSTRRGFGQGAVWSLDPPPGPSGSHPAQPSQDPKP